MAFQFLCPQGHLLEGAESQMGQQAQCPYCGTVFVVPTPGAAPAGYPNPQQPQYPQPAAPGYGAPGYGAPNYGTQGGYGTPAGYGTSGGYGGQPVYGGQPGYGSPPASGYPPAYSAPAAGVPAAGDAAAGPAPAAPATPTASAAPPADKVEPTADKPSKPEPEAAEAPPEEEAVRVVRIPCPQGHELETPMDMIGMEALCPQCGEQFHLRYEDSVEYKEEQVQREERLNRIMLRVAIGAAAVIVLGVIVMIVIAMRK